MRGGVKMDSIIYGKAVLAKFLLCKNDIKDAENLSRLLNASAVRVGAAILRNSTCDFLPMGASANNLLVESGYQIHTWPENKVVTAVFYTCGEINSRDAMLYVGSQLKAKKVKGIIFCYDTEKVVEEFDIEIKEEKI